MVMQFLHDFDLSLGLLHVKGIDSDFLQCVFFPFLVLDQIDFAETALPKLWDLGVIFQWGKVVRSIQLHNKTKIIENIFWFSV